MKKPIVLCAVVAFMLAFSTNVFAERMMFTHSGTGSGTIGGVEFTDASFTITAVGDTENRQSFSSAYWINHDSASIDIENLGCFQFISGTRTFVNNVSRTTGFSRCGPESMNDLYNGPTNSLLANWRMLTSIGPLTGNDFRLLQWDRFPELDTDAGILEFVSQRNITGSFEATIIPEPSILTLLSVCLFSLLVCRWRRK